MARLYDRGPTAAPYRSGVRFLDGSLGGQAPTGDLTYRDVFLVPSR
jgi:hypothetical protein